MNRHKKHVGGIMGGHRIVKDLHLPSNLTPTVGENEFSWELPGKRGHWFVLEKEWANLKSERMTQCTHCDRVVPLDDRVPLDEPNEYLCLSCDDRLKEELDEFTH